jgi:CO dehydrogenase/acetyl-CoA synthase delta subunit
MGQSITENLDYPDIDKIVTDNEFVNLVRDITDLSLRKDLDYYLVNNPLTDYLSSSS